MRPGAWTLWLLPVLAGVLGPPTVAAEVVAIVSARSAVTSLSRSQAADLFLGRTLRFPNGERAVPLDQPEGSPARDGFYREFAERSAAQVKAHWSKILFTGRGRPPAEVADGAAAKKRVRSDPHAIAYIERDQADASVRIVSP